VSGDDVANGRSAGGEDDSQGSPGDMGEIGENGELGSENLLGAYSSRSMTSMLLRLLAVGSDLADFNDWGVLGDNGSLFSVRALSRRGCGCSGRAVL
jgi:hypothetical protein